MSAIKNLLRWSPVIAGRIKIGVNKKADNKMGKLPSKITGMLITKDRKDEENLNFLQDHNAHITLEAYDNDKKQCVSLYKIPIEFDSDNIDNFLFVRKAAYKGKTCICSGDGENAKDIDGNNLLCQQCPKNNPEYSGYDKCKVNLSLYVKIVGVTPLGKYHVFKTTGWNSLQALGNSILGLQNEGMGRLRGVIFNLTYGEKNTTDHSGKTRKVPVLSVEFDGTKQDLHRKIIDNANTEAKYMTDMSAINTLKLNNSQDLFIDYSDIEEYYPEAQGLPNNTTQAALPETKVTESIVDTVEDVVIEETVVENTVAENTVPEPTQQTTEKTQKEIRDELVVKLGEFGWTVEMLKGKRIPTLQRMLEEGELPLTEEEQSIVGDNNHDQGIQESEQVQETEQPQSTQVEEEIPNFVPQNQQQNTGFNI